VLAAPLSGSFPARFLAQNCSRQLRKPWTNSAPAFVFFLPAVLPPVRNPCVQAARPADLFRNIAMTLRSYIAMTLRSYRADRGAVRLDFLACTLCCTFGFPSLVGAVQVASTPRIRPREVLRYDGSEAHGANKSRPSNLKLPLVEHWYGSAVCAERSRHIRHICAQKGLTTSGIF
jgi:hypothetical protein